MNLSKLPYRSPAVPRGKLKRITRAPAIMSFHVALAVAPLNITAKPAPISLRAPRNYPTETAIRHRQTCEIQLPALLLAYCCGLLSNFVLQPWLQK